MKLCEKCGTEHEKPGRFCSRKCANSRKHTKETRDKISEKATRNASIKGPPKQILKECIICNTLHSKFGKTCSSECYKKHASNSLKGKTGGYRNGSGHSKSGWYKGVYCGSTYELCWVIYNIDHNIKFERFPCKLQWGGISYIPDFLSGDGKTIIEIKGFEDQISVDKKTAVANHHGFDVVVLRQIDLLFAFDYVRSIYGTAKFETLYDGYKPSFTYRCSNCHQSYDSDKIKSSMSFCSRSCAGKYRKTQNSSSIDREHCKYTRNLSKEIALEIYYSDKTLKELSTIYEVSSQAIWFIKNKKTYKWIHKKGNQNDYVDRQTKDLGVCVYPERPSD